MIAFCLWCLFGLHVWQFGDSYHSYPRISRIVRFSRSWGLKAGNHANNYESGAVSADRADLDPAIKAAVDPFKSSSKGSLQVEESAESGGSVGLSSLEREGTNLSKQERLKLVRANIVRVLGDPEVCMNFRSKEWQDLLDLAIQWNLKDLAIQILYRMQDLYINIHSHTITELLSALCQYDMYDEALEIFDNCIAYGMEPTVHNFSPLLKTCGSASKAHELFQRMENCGLSPNVISYTAAIKSCEPYADFMSVLSLMDMMRSCGVQPNEVTYCCVISVASRGMQGALAINMLREMLAYGLVRAYID